MDDIDMAISQIANLNTAITNALEREVADAVKKELMEHITSYDYPYSRGAGGLSDPSNLHEIVEQTGSDTFTLVVTNDAPFQGAKVDYTTLAEVIDEGNPNFHQTKARPFYDPTHDSVISSGVLGQALEIGLARQGIDTTGFTFDFE